MLQSINWFLFNTTKKLTLNFSFRRSKREFSTLEKPRRKISQFLVSRGYIFKVEDLSFWWEDLKRGRGPTFLVGDTNLGFLGRHQKIAYCPHPSPYALARKGRFFFQGFSQKPCSFKRKFFWVWEKQMFVDFFYREKDSSVPKIF